MAHDQHDHDLGLQRDLARFQTTTGRRSILRLFAAAALVPFVGCGSESGNASGNTGDDADSDDADDGGSTTSCETIPEETAGPYPGDGSNGANALALSGIVRSDIRSSLGTATGTAAGIPLTIKLKLVESGAGCGSLAGYAIYLWHCDRDGNYSMYTVPSENYLRGVQETDDEGMVTFTTIFPACYSGRMPHVHFEIYPSLDAANSSQNKVRTSQLALPLDACNEVYATEGYAQSVRNLAQTSFAKDMVFSDGTSLQLPTVTGSVADGYVATLSVAIAP